MSDEMTLYGIKNCDIVKKACKYLDGKAAQYEFVDFRKNLLSVNMLEDWVESVGCETLLNKRSTTYRQLSEVQKNNITIELIIEQPTLIKRPVLTSGTGVLVGFTESSYKQFMS